MYFERFVNALFYHSPILFEPICRMPARELRHDPDHQRLLSCDGSQRDNRDQIVAVGDGLLSIYGRCFLVSHREIPRQARVGRKRIRSPADGISHGWRYTYSVNHRCVRRFDREARVAEADARSKHSK
jgi:hypothetical protein